jgi:hypothetical protein
VSESRESSFFSALFSVGVVPRSCLHTTVVSIVYLLTSKYRTVTRGTGTN